MWARRCGAPPLWPSRVRVVVQSSGAAFVGVAIYEFLMDADVGYLDIYQPISPEVRCVTQWPERNRPDLLYDREDWIMWSRARSDASAFLRDHACNANLDGATCRSVSIPIGNMHRRLGLPLNVDGWRTDMLEVYSHWVLYLSLILWFTVLFHDLSLLSAARDRIFDFYQIRIKFPCLVRLLYVGTGLKTFARLVREDGVGPFFGERWLAGQNGRILGVLLAPFIFIWGVTFFVVVWWPALLLSWLYNPIALSRLGIFMNSLMFGIFGLAVTLGALAFVVDPSTVPGYAMTWRPVTSNCICGCVFPIKHSGCAQLVLIGGTMTYRAFLVAFQCLKGLRRNNWATLMTVQFPIPVTAWPVKWTKADGAPIDHRKEHEDVQGELAFDPFALMDEQIDSGATTVILAPTLSRDISDRSCPAPSRQDLLEYIGCCGFPCPAKRSVSCDDVAGDAKEDGDHVHAGANGKTRSSPNANDPTELVPTLEEKVSL